VRARAFLLVGLSTCGGKSARAPDGVVAVAAGSEIVTFPSGTLTLHGSLYRPQGAGPFPAVLYNHGSAGGMLSVQAADALGPVFAKRGWVFLMPYRRGQGLSSDAGPYIGDEIDAAEKSGGPRAAAATTVRLLEHEHLDDQLSALAWLKQLPYVRKDSIAVAGTSFGGIETVFGAERGSYCAAIDSAGAAMMWADTPELQDALKRSVRNARVPIFFFQAENDFDLTPSRVLSAEMNAAGKPAQIKIYPPYGSSKQQGHTLGYFGASIWSDDVFRFLEQNCVTR
jgi:dienelactone hydrolase